MDQGCVIIDLIGTELSPDDQILLAHPATAGVILFARNYENPQQLAQLTRNIHQSYPHLLITVDHEGGRVQRFIEGFTRLNAMSAWGELFEEDPQQALAGLSHDITTAVTELQAVGIDFNLAPVLDLQNWSNQVIGERSFSADPKVVTELGRCVIEAMHKSGFPAVGKHFPGHGGVSADSHHELPVDTRSLDELSQADMLPFKSLVNSLDAIMPAHVIYSECDALPAGFSSYWLQQVLRKKLGFTGLIISDDLSMAAAASIGSPSKRAQLALQAGCDLICVCNQPQAAAEVLDMALDFAHPASLQRVQQFCETRLKVREDVYNSLKT